MKVISLKYQIPVSGVQTHEIVCNEYPLYDLKYQIPVSGVQTDRVCISMLYYILPEIPDSSKWSSNEWLIKEE